MAHLLRQRRQDDRRSATRADTEVDAGDGAKPAVVAGGKATMSALYSSAVAGRALLKARARIMRHHPTLSEQLVWSAIRGGRLGVAFRRQQVVGQFIVDFLCTTLRLVIEVDGDAYHATRVRADIARDRKLARAGYTVLRIPASLVKRDLARAVECNCSPDTVLNQAQN